MPKRVRRLFDMDVDEISTVDRAANQHAAIVFSKRAEPEEADMPGELYDAEGVEVFEDELESGDTVYDENGDEFVYLDEEDAAELEAEDFEDSDERELVGKKFSFYAPERAREGFKLGRYAAKEKLGLGETRTLSGMTSPGGRVYGASALAGRYAVPGAVTAGGTAVGGGGYAVARRRKRKDVEKSYGVYDELSKALEDADNTTAISKMADMVAEAQYAAELANARAQAIEEAFEESEYISKASEYNLPVAPDALGSVLHRAAQTLSKRDLAILDRALSASGEGMFAEIGTAGGAQPEIMYEVEAYADSLVGKSDLTREEAVVAMFEANPAAYEEYLAEQNGR